MAMDAPGAERVRGGLRSGGLDAWSAHSQNFPMRAIQRSMRLRRASGLAELQNAAVRDAGQDEIPALWDIRAAAGLLMLLVGVSAVVVRQVGGRRDWRAVFIRGAIQATAQPVVDSSLIEHRILERCAQRNVYPRSLEI